MSKIEPWKIISMLSSSRLWHGNAASKGRYVTDRAILLDTKLLCDMVLSNLPDDFPALSQEQCQKCWDSVMKNPSTTLGIEPVTCTVESSGLRVVWLTRQNGTGGSIPVDAHKWAFLLCVCGATEARTHETDNQQAIVVGNGTDFGLVMPLDASTLKGKAERVLAQSETETGGKS